jgi:phage-related protein
VSVAFKSATSAGAYTPVSGTITVTTPGAVVSGDLLVAIIFTTGGSPAPPVGWTQIGSDGVTSGVSIGRAWYKVAGSSEPGSYDWSVSATDSTVLLMSAYTGADTGNPVETLTWGGSTSATTSQIAPASSPTMTGAMQVSAWGATGGGGSYTPPAGMTEFADVTTAWQFGAGAYDALDASGSTGTRTATCNTSTGYLSVSIVLVPAGSASGDEVTVWVDAEGSMLPLAVEWRASGRFAPPTEREEEAVPGQPGARLRTVRHGVRDFSLALWITGTDEADLRTQMRALTYSMDGVRGDGRIRVTAPGGDQREIACRVTAGLEMTEVLGDTSGPTAQRAVVTFRAVDPYWQDTTDTASGPWAQGGTAAGFFPFFPLRLTSSEVLATAIVDNLGDVDAWPVWTIAGPGSTITLRNQSTGKVLTLDTTLLGGESVVIDTRPGYKTVTKNDGSNLYGSLSSASSLWSLQRGANSIQIEIGGATSATSVSVLRRHKYLAV